MSPSDLSWDGDNRVFILNHIIPHLDLPDSDKQVMRWAYQFGYELESDGETVVKDMFLNGVIKSPAGVTHDYLNRVPGHRTPDGKVWSRWAANRIYRDIHKALGSDFRLRWRRWLGLTISGYIPFITWWR